MSEVKVNKISPRSGTDVTLGDASDTFTVPTGAGLTVVDEVKTNKISPATGTAFTLGDSSDTFTLPSGATIAVASGATIANSGTATGFGDTTAIENDIATLALHQATNANAAKYNLVNTNVDQYEDSTGVASFTTCARDTDGEYVSSVYLSEAHQALTESDYGGGNIGGPIITDPAAARTTAQDGVASSGFAYTLSSSVSGYVELGLGASYTISRIDLGKRRGNGDPLSLTLTYGTGAASSTSADSNVDFTSATSTVIWNDGNAANLSNMTSSGTADWAALDTNGDGVICKVTGFSTFSARWFRYKFDSATFHDANAHWTELKVYAQTTSDNATGNYVSTATTANAATTTMGAVITYKNQAGINALNTDIILQVSADGGSNYTTATLTAAGTFSTGILQAVANDITVTSGTSIQYKISFVNQASASKEARIYGVSLMY